MSIFPTRILLATDGSGGAELAAKTAAELARTKLKEQAQKLSEVGSRGPAT